MATNVTLNGVTYSIPAEGDGNWGTVLSNFFISIASNVLQKTGGNFTLTADVDFGATYGLKSAMFKTRTSNPATSGVMRLANAEYIGWRNAANSANLLLGVNSSNVLTFNGSALSGASVTGSTGTPSDITAAGGIAFTGSAPINVWFVQGDGGPQTIVANPQIAAGTVVGQILFLILVDDTKGLTFANGTGIKLNGDVLVMDSEQIPKMFIWDGTDWICGG